MIFIDIGTDDGADIDIASYTNCNADSDSELNDLTLTLRLMERTVMKHIGSSEKMRKVNQ